MSLKIDLKPGEKIIVNGAVLKAGKRRVTLILENEAMLLRGKDVMTEAEANTPARRIYFTTMLLYITGGDAQTRARFDQFVDDFLGATSVRELRAALLEIRRDVDAGRHYHAMKTCKWLIQIEAKLLKLGTEMPTEAREPTSLQEAT